MADTVAVLGTGMVAQALVGRLSELGYDVWVGARSADSETLQPFEALPGVQTGSFADVAEHGDILVNATNGANSVSALTLAGADHLAGKPLIDLSNDLRRPEGGGYAQPEASMANSIGRTIQAEFPDVLVVKTLNTMNNKVMVNPSLVPGDHIVFMSGDSADAKARVSGLLQAFGWREGQILDLGGIETAVGPEMAMALWLNVSLARGLDKPPFNWAINSA